MITLTIKKIDGIPQSFTIPKLILIHQKILDYLVQTQEIHSDNLDEIITIANSELLKIVGRVPENYKIPVSINPNIYDLIQRRENAVIATINGMKYIINIDVDLTQPWKSIPWNPMNEYNLNDEPVLPQVPEEKEGGYIFIGNRLWSRETFLKFFIPA